MRPFEINFDFPVASSNLRISLNATVEMHHSELYFVVQNFYLANSKRDNEHHSVLPAQEVKRIKQNETYLWVHKDSEQPSELSIAIGEGIETELTEDELNG